MSQGAVLVVLIISSAGTDPAAPALEEAARELLGESARVRLVVTPTDPPDAATLQRAGTADGVVELIWNDDHQSALLHCYVTRDARWVDRKVTFSSNDEAPARGRLLGFAIASMFPRFAAAPEAADRKRGGSATSVDSAVKIVSKPPAQRARAELELAASATTGVRGPADAVGALVGIRLPVAGAFSVHFAVGARVGEIPPAQASTRSATAALGLTWLASPVDSPYQVGLRADFIASRMEVTRPLNAGGEPESRSRWTSGGAVLLEGGFRLTGGLSAHAGVGTEVLLSPTDVYAGGRFEAKLPTFRVVGELGLRTRF